MLTRAEHPYESAQAYVDAGVEGRERDPMLTFQLRNDFQVIGLMPGYWPEDRQSRGYGIHLLWRNPSAPDEQEEALRDMAMRYNINIIAGSHPTKMANGRVENICYVCLRDGEVHEQAKIHPTPNEVYWWNIEGGHELAAINTDCGPIGALICYDTTPSVETVAFADLGLKALREARNTGTVQNLKDRRHDLYTTVWREH